MGKRILPADATVLVKDGIPIMVSRTVRVPSIFEDRSVMA